MKYDGLTPAEKKALSTCSQCGLVLRDDQPRGFWIEGNAMGVHCISCAEKDQTTLKIGTPKNPISFEGENEPGGIMPY